MYFTWKKVSLFMLIICLVTAGSFAAPHWGDVFEFEQPDMSLVKAKVWGDEFYHRVESLDGYTLVRDPVSNFICYANLKPNAEEYVSTGVVYTGLSVEDIHAFTGKSRGIMTSLSKRLKLKRSVILEKSNRARKDLNSWESNRISALGSEESSVESQMAVAAEAAPLSGSVVGITLLIEFPDVPGTISQSEVNNYCNQVGYSNYSNNGSIRDYFYDISNGLLTYTNEVTVYYTAKNNRSYYTDPDVRYGVRAKELIKEALVWLDDTNGQNFDFDLLSVNSSNRIRAINVFYAGGRVNAWAEGLWPHAAGMNDLFVSNDGPKSGDYQITNIGSSLSLGAFCHENGHMICKWPDLYDSGYESSGTGAYCLMSRGDSHNPLPPNPYLKDLKGWQTVIDITDDPASRISQANSFSCFRYSHPTNSREFFMIENREKSGRSTEIPDSGLLIWHIDKDGSNNNEQMTPEKHYQVSVEQADGLFHLENGRTGGGSNDLFHAGNKDVFNDDTLPDAKWWDGEESGLSIHSISGLSSSMSFITSKEIAIGVTAAGDNPPNETADKAFDGDYSTKWLDFSPTGSWIQNRYAYDARYYITEYAITSANDHPERDPKYWNLLGSNDGGESWDILDSRTGVIFDNRFETQKFSVTSPGTYNIYRLKITAVQDVSIANSVQIAEIQLFSCFGSADFNCDGFVDVDDLSYMADVWLTNDFTADIALPKDGLVNLLDMSILSQQWLGNDAVVITPVGVNASSSYIGKHWSNTIDGVGMTWKTPLEDSTHDSESGNFWHANEPAADVWIEFDLGSEVDLLETMVVWAHHPLGEYSYQRIRGIQQYDLVLEDANHAELARFNDLTLQMATEDRYTLGEIVDFEDTAGVQYVRIEVDSNYDGSNYTGLSEVRFMGEN